MALGSASVRCGASSSVAGSREKNTAHAAKQDRPDVLKRRAAWFAGRRDLDPARLVFIDETWASTSMARTRGRARKGERLRAGVPYGHWKTTTSVAGLRVTGMIAPMVLGGRINGDAFQAYVDRGGRRPPHLPAPPYSPDFNPIENAFAKLKALLRKAAARTVDGLWSVVGRLVDLFTPQECANYFAAAGYDAA